MQTGTHAMKSYAKRVAVVRIWLFAVTAVWGLIAGSAAIAHYGKYHIEGNLHVLYGTKALLMMMRGERLPPQILT